MDFNSEEVKRKNKTIVLFSLSNFNLNLAYGT